MMTERATDKPRILLLSAYDAASHRRWREQLVAMFSEFEWQSLVLPPRFFRWRIRGNPVTWLNEPAFAEHWDLVIATSMVDLATLRGIHPSLVGTPCLLYVHENQFAFPESGSQFASVDPQVVNLYSAIAADHIAFNSRWNRDSFLSGAWQFLEKMPDGVPEGLIEGLGSESTVLPVPVEDRLFRERSVPFNSQCPHLLWNHRWEYDKGPERLVALLDVLEQRGMAYRLSVVGEQFRRYPRAFDELKQRFGHRLVHWGYLEQRADYDALLHSADVVVSTALHDFQGLSMLEAMASGCLPLAPDRLAYREYVPAACRYSSHEKEPQSEAQAAADCLAAMVQQLPAPSAPHDWRASRLATRYRELFRAMLEP